MKPVFEYGDYREFLRDSYLMKKGENPVVTHKYMGSKVGYNASGYFTQVVKGRINISLEMAHGFASFFGLTKKEAEYFEALVLFNQARSHNEKKTYYEKMISFKEASAKTLAPDQYEYFSNWYNIAVRELLYIYRFSGNYEELARLVQPSITPEQARQAIAVLERVGLIRKGEGGAYQITDRHITSGFAESPAAGNYIRNSLEMAKQSLDNVPRNERELSSITISISKDGYDEITKELQDFRNRIRSIIEKHSNPDRGYQFSFQVYPITKTVPKEKR